MNCTHCHQPLNRSLYKANRTLKSCPRCSTANGSQHVFYEYKAAFGTTPLRATPANPDGPQSYCTACRGDQEQTEFIPVLCSEINT